VRAGFVFVGIAVYSEQTGDVEVVVPFAVGRADQRLGLIVATERRPRGPAAVVDQWGEQLIAAAWSALLDMTLHEAHDAGHDEHHEPLMPAAIMATDRALSITPQARHAFDRRER
jgi:hypothetical protein